MRYNVRGVWKLSGEIAEIRVTADGEEAARRYADAVGIIALDVEPDRPEEEIPGHSRERESVA